MTKIMYLLIAVALGLLVLGCVSKGQIDWDIFTHRDNQVEFAK